MNIISSWNWRYRYNVTIGRGHLTRNKLWIYNKRCRQRGSNTLYDSSIIAYWIIDNSLLRRRINITLNIFDRINSLVYKLSGILSIMMFILIKPFLILLVVMLLIILCISFIIIILVSSILNTLGMLLFVSIFVVSMLVLIRLVNHLQNWVESFRNLTRNRPSLSN